ncbi:hypothetical protein Lal_00009865 [Lupinus albus]|uniref:Putative transcription factor WD40-like family n=1 Tax=Lupinus albus TaxID=3870 RepID=A0A6A5LCW9_LUPAL|nr:putative transcription factor WD40-like family [Lupinus albus]KAF1859281.1 hypothetical protein Lal_00009865 [Lupinus albus]
MLRMEIFHKPTNPHSFTHIFRREFGFSHPITFPRHFSASQVIVKKLNLYGKLNGHEGCVNAVEFNYSGDMLVSGSDDKQVILWNWASNVKLLAYPSGHSDNIFQTKIMPFTNDSKIVTSAGDGQVRLGLLREEGKVDTTVLGKHRGCVYKLAVEPGSPHILYSCGEDGFIHYYDLRSSSATRLFSCSSLAGNNKHPPRKIRLNSIVIDSMNPYYFAVGGSDEYARVYDIRTCQWDASEGSDRPVSTFCPQHLIGSCDVHITALAYSSSSELLVSYNDELIYLFEKNAGFDSSSSSSAASEDSKNLQEAQVYSGHRNAQTIKGVNFFGPNDEYVLSGSDCGHIFIWKKKGAELVRLMVGDQQVVNQLEPHPHMPILATCGIENDVKIWAPLATDIPPLPVNVKEITEANRQSRENRLRVSVPPNLIMHVLRLQRQQTLAYVERRYNRDDIVSGEDAEGFGLGLSDGEASSEEDSGANSRDCNIS